MTGGVRFESESRPQTNPVAEARERSSQAIDNFNDSDAEKATKLQGCNREICRLDLIKHGARRDVT
jgi:hypothetical protein